MLEAMLEVLLNSEGAERETMRLRLIEAFNVVEDLHGRSDQFYRLTNEADLSDDARHIRKLLGSVLHDWTDIIVEGHSKVAPGASPVEPEPAVEPDEF